MARTTNENGPTIAELERMLSTRRGRLQQMQRDRDRLQQRLDALDRKIATVAGRGGAGGAGGGGRARNKISLVAAMEAVLKQAGKPLPVGDIMAGVQAQGYRSTSANFRALVNQTLIKDKRFTAAGRGVYQLKKQS